MSPRLPLFFYALLPFLSAAWPAAAQAPQPAVTERDATQLEVLWREGAAADEAGAEAVVEDLLTAPAWSGPRALAALADPSAPTRERALAARVLGGIDEAPAREALAAAADDRATPVRRAFCAAAAARPADAFLPKLIDLVGDRDNGVRCAALRALAAYHDRPAAVEAIQKAAQSLTPPFRRADGKNTPAGDRRDAARDALDRIPRDSIARREVQWIVLELAQREDGGAGTGDGFADLLPSWADTAILDRLLALTQQEKPSRGMRRTCYRALARIRDARAVEALLSAAETETGTLRDEAFAALETLTGEEIPREPDAWKTWWAGAKARGEFPGAK